MTEDGRIIPREYIGYAPTDPEILAGFVNFVQAPIPIDETLLVDGLRAAAQKTAFLGRFVDENGSTVAFLGAIAELEKQKLLARDNGFWIIPPSSDKLNPPGAQLNSKTRSIFKQPGVEALTLAAEAARQVWSQPKPQESDTPGV